MQQPYDLPVYEVPFVRVLRKVKCNYFTEFLPGEELAVYDEDDIVGPPDEGNIRVIKHEAHGNCVYQLPLTHLWGFVKEIRPLFKIGDVIIPNTNRPPALATRVHHWGIDHTGAIFYTDGFQEKTGLASISYERNHRLAVGDEMTMWSVKYDDDLAAEAKEKAAAGPSR